ncbi:hypothetical protein EJ03DRAFT_350026 [Teratosphaeria nubilosa]|uniref:Uncharacterized protein n=1 Tax=Teratosphaeria nubilosa TaxID=161662 RepID=A0A6G1LDJ7_9PEZI|nr:hypothetical protein EJ03DRAFT_350026 [Teratosphaeria nubilosa]
MSPATIGVLATITKFFGLGRVPYRLLYGTPGSGKTSTVLALARRIYEQQEYATDGAGVSAIITSHHLLLACERVPKPAAELQVRQMMKTASARPVLVKMPVKAKGCLEIPVLATVKVKTLSSAEPYTNLVASTSSFW